MRLSHLLLVHSNLDQTKGLISRLTHPNADIYVHIDSKLDIEQSEEILKIPNIFFIRKRHSIIWGNYSMVEATLSSFEEILKTKVQYSHINLLSGQDYPLKSANFIDDFLQKNIGKSFIKYLSIPEEWDEPLSRFQKYNLGDLHFPGKNYLQTIINKIMPPKKLPNRLKAYGGSQWITITPKCAEYVIQYLKDNRSVRNFFLMTWAADELIFQTILLNSPHADSIVNDHLRYIKFSKGSSRPKIFTSDDDDELISSGKLYGRKFDLFKDSKILDF